MEVEKVSTGDSSDPGISTISSRSETPLSLKEKKAVIGKTADGTTFEVPETHDMVRSLFDPTLRKSYAELIICATLFANFGIYHSLETKENRVLVFLCLYGFWRLCYNLGIGVLLYKQSNGGMLVNWAKKYKLFQKGKKESVLQVLVDLEIKSKMGRDYEPDQYPVEFNTWIIFRQFVDLILMQDFTTYMFLVYTCGIDGMFAQSPLLNYTRIVLGSLMVVFNFWVKVDAHRVVKDYAWYWGDFFFLEENELIFDGVFNLSPHPMYSIGYIGYYGFALMTKSYLVLCVSLAAHALQFAFLNYVEEPHIEKTYGSDTTEIIVEELETNESYLKPLMIFKNFNPIRISDYLTVLIAIYNVIAPFVVAPSNDIYTLAIFAFALVVKLTQSCVVSYVLHRQSEEKWWTKLYLKYGQDNVTAYSSWQAAYNLLLVLSYTSLFSCVCREVLNGQYKLGTWLPLRIILGSLLILLQLWTSSSIYHSIGDFGWFYGDFFLPNLSTKTLSKSGIYRYLNDPERLLGVTGIWGATLITYSPFVFILAMVWTIHMSLHLTFVEKPHMIKVYGEQQVKKNVSGVSLTLQQIIPKKWNNTFDALYSTTVDKGVNFIKKRTQSETVDRSKVRVRPQSGSISTGFTVELVDYKNGEVEIGSPLRVKWTTPVGHGKKDWIGLYPVMKTASSRRHTHVSSAGKWVGVDPAGYEERPGCVVEKGTLTPSGEVAGIVEFKADQLWFERGVYELRYHADGSHKVKAISHPFEIVVPELKVDEKLPTKLLELVQRVYAVKSIDETLNFKKVSAKQISDLVSTATGIDIASEVVLKLKTISNICSRINRSKKILDELNKD